MLVPIINERVVLLPGHEHPEFGEPGFHYHIDWRYEDGEPKQSDVIFSEALPTYEERLQIRKTYVLNASGFNLTAWLVEKYGENKIKDGKCPHKGLPIISGVCTGHCLPVYRGKVCSELYLKVGNNKTKMDYKIREYVFEIQSKEYIDRLELVTPYSKILGTTRIGPFNVDRRDKLKINLF